MKIPKRFSLRFVFALMTGTAIWCAYESHREMKCGELVASIEKAGGSVSTIDTGFSVFPSTKIVKVTIPYWSLDEFSDEQFALLPNLTEIEILDVQIEFPTSNETDRSLPITQALMHVTSMTFQSWSVSPAAKELLAKLRDRQQPISIDEWIEGHKQVSNRPLPMGN